MIARVIKFHCYTFQSFLGVKYILMFRAYIAECQCAFTDCCIIALHTEGIQLLKLVLITFI